MVLDASDGYSTTAQFISQNTFQNVANGLVYILNPPAPTGSAFSVGDSFFDGNIFSNVGISGFLLWAYPNQTSNKPLTQRIRLRNTTILSNWGGLYLDGGGYAFLGSNGVTDVSLHGSTITAGSSGTASQLLLFSGQPQSGNSITVKYTPPSGGPTTWTVTAPSAEPLSALVTALAAQINASGPLTAGSVVLANAYYGMLFVSTKTAPSPGITNGTVTVSTTGSGAYPIAVVTPGSGGSYTATMLAGNGIYLANNPHSVDVTANTLDGSQGAGMYIASVTHLNAFANAISNSLGSGNTYGISFDPAATYPNTFIQTNDLTGNVSGAIGGGATPAPATSAVLLRNNRGYSPVGSAAPPFPPVGTTTFYPTYDCYVSITGLPASGTNITVTGNVSNSQFTPPIAGGNSNFNAYAGSKLVITYTSGSPSWAWFCN
jgi:hypothetical protein